ncbi:hypothetical protein WOLCODRAFT_145799 [Wolfiporia cocos MD-104 SS10]|uniref:Uncharacterized protein n=1 Tax=Wolfiporia cocos (strain MD-104) TaxID=742152 RepID=A0A2H3JCI1_WOLCO|nr:hypothetical protein WOLCODRAFT_145799 [Wolfiporia cocos MD-104 SS10]
MAEDSKNIPIIGAGLSGRHTRQNAWFLTMSNLLSATSVPRRHVILVFGVPTYQDLIPLLLSGHYAHSLVILATHQPPDIPHIILPALRVLLLSTPLSAEKSDAARYLDVMARAERIAYAWRKHGGSGISEVPEEDEVGFRPDPHSPRRASGSDMEMARTTPTKSMQSSPKRSFDALINFIATDVPDHAVLKQTVLITAISRPFMSTETPNSTSYSGAYAKCKSLFGTIHVHSGHRRSQSAIIPNTHLEGLFNFKSSVVNPLSPTTSPHVIHLLPRSAAQQPRLSLKLVENMEAFLSAFAATADLSGVRESDILGTARAFIMYAPTFGAALDCALSRHDTQTRSGFIGDGWGCEWTVADVVLSGALDDAVNLVGDKSVPSDGRAWISDPADIVLMQTAGHARTFDATTGSALNKQSRREGIYVPAPEAAREPEKAPVQRPETPYSLYSTSYGHSLIGSSPPSFHEVSRTADDPSSIVHSDMSPPTAFPATAAEVQTDMKDKKSWGAGIPRRISIEKVQSLLSVWKELSAKRRPATEKGEVSA